MSCVLRPTATATGARRSWLDLELPRTWETRRQPTSRKSVMKRTCKNNETCFTTERCRIQSSTGAFASNSGLGQEEGEGPPPAAFTAPLSAMSSRNPFCSEYCHLTASGCLPKSPKRAGSPSSQMSMTEHERRRRAQWRWPLRLRLSARDLRCMRHLGRITATSTSSGLSGTKARLRNPMQQRKVVNHGPELLPLLRPRREELWAESCRA